MLGAAFLSAFICAEYMADSQRSKIKRHGIIVTDVNQTAAFLIDTAEKCIIKRINRIHHQRQA
ncbi:hypothetical protein NQ315_009012 [Exocentrus adspersus]|uniref:Uncharacterized protein n=1 Tax=Exocentrus adspersus TaxID=1586481 RepID=A0AAV8VGS9_9CUCU|nr:hypothetical protein NQ315_009012 [Exocentrus adspersus]